MPLEDGLCSGIASFSVRKHSNSSKEKDLILMISFRGYVSPWNMRIVLLLFTAACPCHLETGLPQVNNGHPARAEFLMERRYCENLQQCAGRDVIEQGQLYYREGLFGNMGVVSIHVGSPGNLEGLTGR